MSMFGAMGAETAAREILALVREKIAENHNNPEVVKVLREIETKARQISESAADGYY